MRKSDRVAFICFGVFSVALFGGIQIAGMMQQKSPGPRELSWLCPGDPAANPHPENSDANQAAYQGAGPHPILLAGAVTIGDDFPKSWSPPQGDESLDQLVACVYQQTTTPDQKCAYYGLDGKVTLLNTIYITQIYEARGARRVDTLRIPGLPGCPSELDYQKGHSPGPTISEDPDYERIINALRPYVERTVDPRGSPEPS